ncbi:C-terminal binding protein [Georgenia alba]|uniref:C-terminal binding protein n=1 Tax=Georgenia alba TaxID=2233858 RepID=A0ABW2Q8I4_9MICO
MAVTDTAVPDETLERELAEQTGAEYRSVRDGLGLDEVLDGADVVFTNFATLGPQELARLAPGAVVVRYGVGVDNVDLAAAARLGVRVTNVPDYGADVVADHAATLAGLAVRRVMTLDRRMRAGEQPIAAEAGRIRSFAALTVGLVGAGRIARLVGRRLAAFGARIVAADPYADAEALAAEGLTLVDVETLLAEADVISLHAPLTDETRHLLDDATLARVRPGVVVVNTARGGLVDTDALLRALDAGRVAVAALDVTEPEPLPADHPLRTHPNVVLTPHSAFYAEESMARLQSLAVDEGRRALAGEPLRSPVPLPDTGGAR